MAWLSGKHELASDELYYKSSFIKNLNRGEKIGGHLNHDVEYGNIYGFPDDWVVDSSSADLNGVLSKSFSGIKHSTVISLPGTSITVHNGVQKKVKEWLTHEIYKPQLRDFRMVVSQGFGEVYIVEYYTGNIDERKVGFYPTGIETWQRLKTGEGMATIKLMLDNQEWGTIYLNRHSEIRVGLFSPKLMEIKFMEGSARFKSRGGHFQVNIKDEGIIRGLDTDFVITVEDNIKVYCLEGRLIVVTPEATEGGTILSANNSVAVKGETVIAIVPPTEDDFWWSSEDDELFEEGPSTPTPSPTQQRLYLVADGDVYAYSYRNWNWANWGMYETMGAGWHPTGGEKRAYLRFDLPAGLGISRAVLKLYQYHSAGPVHSLGVYRVTSSWEEGTGTYHSGEVEETAAPGELCWKQQPSFDPVPVATFTSATAVPAWVEVDITSLVQQWQGGTPNYGLVIKTTNEHPTASNPEAKSGFCTKEHPDQANHPVLELSLSGTAPLSTPALPGFEAVFAIAGLLAVAYPVLRRKRK